MARSKKTTRKKTQQEGSVLLRIGLLLVLLAGLVVASLFVRVGERTVFAHGLDLVERARGPKLVETVKPEPQAPVEEIDAEDRAALEALLDR